MEILVPFGKGDREDEQENTLKKVLDFTTNKYAALIRSLKGEISTSRRKKRFERDFLPFLISSLGALSNKSITNLTKMIETET
jgi:excinuclease UvrABC nuclease subunit